MTLIVLGNGMTTASILLVPVIGWFCRVRIFSDFFACIIMIANIFHICCFFMHSSLISFIHFCALFFFVSSRNPRYVLKNADQVYQYWISFIWIFILLSDHFSSNWNLFLPHTSFESCFIPF